MKRIISLILAVALILSIAILPAAANDKPDVELDVVSFTDDGNTFKEVAPGKGSYSKGDKIAVRIRFVNDGTERYLSNYDFFVSYDATALKPYTFTSGRKTIGPAVSPDASAMVESKQTEIGKVLIKGINFNVTIPANETATLAWIMFTVENETGAEEVETAAYDVSLYGEDNEIGFYIDDVDFAPIKGIAYNGKKTQVSVNGVAPTIKSVAIDPYTATYGQAGEYELKVLSTKDKDITSLVDWTVSPADTGVSVANGKLTVTAAAPAGTYTVTASGRAGESQGTAFADFTIAKAQIGNGSASVAISGFGKGLPVNGVTTTWSKGLELVSIEWVKDGKKVTSGNFIGSSTYTANIKFKADANHDFIGTSMGVSGISSKSNSLTRGEDGVHTLTLVLETAARTELEKIESPSVSPQAHYGMKLRDLTISGGKVIVKGDEAETAIKGHFDWMNPNESVGDPTVYEGSTDLYRKFFAKFVPDDAENYAVLENIALFVDVHKATISIDGKLNDWNYTAAFKYDGTEHTVELVIPDDLKDKITVTYENNKKTDVDKYTAVATIGAADDAYYAIFEENKTRNLTWEIVKGDLTPTANPVKSVRYGITTVMVYPSELGLPSGLTVTATPDNALVTAAAANADGSVTLTLKDTTVDDADVTTGKVTLIYSSDNYNPATVDLTVKIIDKTENRETLKVKVPASVEYGMGISPDVSETKPADSGAVTFTYYNEAGDTLAADSLATAPVGKYKVVATCEDENTIYIGEAEFEIVAREIKAEDVVLGSNLTYTGNELTQTVTVTVGGKELTKDTDYTVTGLTGKEPGDYTVTVTGKGNYKGTVEKTFTIGKATIPADGIIFDVGPYVYTGEKWEPEVTVTFNGNTLTAGTNYTVSYEDNINAGTAKVIITGKGAHFTGTTTKTFTIEKASLSGCAISPIKAVTYNAKAQTPALTVAKSARTLQLGTDYEVVYTNNTDAGTANVTVKGTGNFKDTETTTFTINKADLTLNGLTLSSLYTETEPKTEDLSSVGFCAGETNTKFTVTIGAPDNAAIFAVVPAVASDENKVTYQLSGTIGTAVLTVTVTPTSANYNPGTYTLTIEANDKTNVSGRITFESGSAVYTGSGIAYEKATISGLSGSMSYSYTPDSATGASLDTAGLPLTVGTYTVTATYSDASSYGYKTATFTITKATPTGTPSFTKIETSGKTLADTKLTVGTIRPAGTIAWNLPATTEVEANKEYTWTFTPTDTHNYKPLTGKLTPYVVSNMPYLPGVIGNTGSFSFRDVSRFDYFYDAVKWASENGIASGTSNYTFSPDAVCTRAQTVTFLWRAAGSPMPRYRVSPFTDVNAYDYYYNAVLWAVEQGITTGLTATTFGPDETVTRGQVATFLYRAASAAKPNTFNPFTDVKATAYNYNAILWAYDNRITTGTSTTTFSPDASCTRAQIVTFLYRYYQGR
mgnify:CR=1 FL=1